LEYKEDGTARWGGWINCIPIQVDIEWDQIRNIIYWNGS